MRLTFSQREQASEVLTRAFQEDVKVSELTSISEGWESEMYSFDVEYGPAGERKREELVLRIYPGDDAHAKSAREFHGMRQLYEAGYPVPQVLVLERADSPLGKPFVIMERIAGQVLWPLLFGSSGKEQQRLLTLFCDRFVQLHALDWRPFVDGADRYEMEGPHVFVDQWLDTGREFLARSPMPGFLPVVEWLEKRRDGVPCLRPSVVHLDFHPGNVLLRGDGSAVVVDWTQLAVSDPRFDLAWTLLLVGTHEDARWRDPILQEYERLARVRVEQIEYFDVVACVKRLVSVAISLSDGPERLGMRPEAVSLMKRQMGAIRKVYDLLLERTGIKVPEIEDLLATV